MEKPRLNQFVKDVVFVASGLINMVYGWIAGFLLYILIRIEKQ